MEIVAAPDPGLGNHSYVIGLGDGSAAVVDPVRDPGRYLAVADARGWRIRWALETHLHADFVSGSRELAAYGAEVAVPAAARVAFSATGLADADQLDLAGLTLEALATPGHTPEHLAYLLRDGATPLALFSGGALIPGGVARPDLLGAERAEPLARAAWRSLQARLLALPDDLAVYPTHGAGSFCSAGIGTHGSTTIGAERAHNSLLQAGDEDAFVRQLLGGLGSYPRYFLELRSVNQAGPAIYGRSTPALERLDGGAVARALDRGAELVDVRTTRAFAAAHVPGSLSIPFRDQFAVWLGWLVERDRGLVFVADESTDREALVRACLKIGYERLAGELAGGVAAWRASGRPVGRLPVVDAAHAGGQRRVVDVRQAAEWRAGHVAGAVNVELGAVAGRVRELAGVPVLVHCGHGERAMSAASLLARAGHPDVAVLAGGPAELAAATGRPLQRT